MLEEKKYLTAGLGTLSARDAAKKEFSRRLQRRMNEVGMNQVSLAAAASKFLTDETFDKGTISAYIRGRSLPLPRKAVALAKALGCEVADLVPSGAIRPAMRDIEDGAQPEIKVFDDGTARLIVNKVMPADVAYAAFDLITGRVKPAA